MGVPTSIPRGERSLGVEPSREAYSALGTSSLWRPSCRADRYCRIAAGRGWLAAVAVLSPFQYVRCLYAVY